jgi:methylenetetrahydrofolate dehydrogenase (NADP+) / methenyltetrahydrofolate cyclohydrolase
MILFGKPVAEKIYQDLKSEIEKLKERKIIPSLGVILVGENPASLSYVKVKEKIAASLGIDFRLFHLPGIAQESKVEELLESLNLNKFISGIVVQLPLPEDFNREKILKKIAPGKDVDGFYGEMPAPTAEAILEMLKFYKLSLKDKKIVLVGRGRLVGQPLEKMLLKKGLKPIVCDMRTANLKKVVKSGEIIISATGVPGIITPEMVGKETIVIDAGTAESGGKLAGDVDPKVYDIVPAYSPVPGGVGPLTVALLMKNVALAAKK